MTGSAGCSCGGVSTDFQSGSSYLQNLHSRSSLQARAAMGMDIIG